MLWKRKNWIRNFEIPYELSIIALHLENMERELLTSMGKEDMEILVIRVMEEEIRANSEIEEICMDSGKIRSAITGNRKFGWVPDTRENSRETRVVRSCIHMMHGGPVSHELICQCHALLSPVPDKAWGKYRDHPESVYDENGVSVYDAPDAPEIPRLMDAFVQWWDRERPKLPLPLGSALAHLFFETIHPFHDGNGRIGRMLADKAWEKDSVFLRVFSVSSVIIRDRNRYYTAIDAAQAQGKLVEWLSYMLEMQETALREAEERAHRLKDIGKWLARTNFQPDKSELEIIFEMGLSNRRYWTEFEATRHLEDDEVAEKAWTRLTKAGIIRNGELDLDAPCPACELGAKIATGIFAMLTTEELEERKQNRYVGAALDLLEKLSGNFNPDTDNAAYIAGGIAVIFWIQDFRVTQDLDAIFDGELLAGKTITKRNDDLFIDFNFNDTLSLVQEDYRERAVPVGKFGSLTVFVVAPVDLILMKISRGTEKDMSDVKMLVESGFVDREELDRLAKDAFKIYVGNPAYPKSNLAKAMEFFDAETAPAYRPRP